MRGLLGLALLCGFLAGCDSVAVHVEDATKSEGFASLPVPPGEVLAAVVRVDVEGYSLKASKVGKVWIDGIEIRHAFLDEAARPESGDAAGFHAVLPVYHSDGVDWARSAHRVKVEAGFGSAEGEACDEPTHHPVVEICVRCMYDSPWARVGAFCLFPLPCCLVLTGKHPC